MNFIDLCAGIGGIRLGLEQAGHKCVGFCEFDKFALLSYKAIHNTEGEAEFHDITKVTDDQIRELAESRRIDIIAGGFPCQSFSVAGKRQGFDDIRGNIFFEIARFIKIIKPRYFICENVKGLLTHNGGRTFGTIIGAMAELGYCVEWQILNSKDYGVPQNRERVFFVGHLGTGSAGKVFPIVPADGENPCRMQEITSGVLVAPVLTPDREKRRQNGRRMKEPGEPAFTLNTQDRHGVAIFQRSHGFNGGGEHEVAPTLTSSAYQENNLVKMPNARIRKFTARECWRLQGFPDEYFDRAKAAGVSDSQLYKQAGNAVTVNVAAVIGRKLAEISAEPFTVECEKYHTEKRPAFRIVRQSARARAGRAWK